MAGSVRPSSMNDGRLSDSRRVFAREERVPVRGIVPPDQKDFIKRATYCFGLSLWGKGFLLSLLVYRAANPNYKKKIYLKEVLMKEEFTWN
jgi:hypothetical protein